MSMVELEGEDPMLDVIRKIERIRIAQSDKPESVTSKVSIHLGDVITACQRDACVA